MALRGTMRPAVSISGSVKKASGGGGNVSFVTDETLSFVDGVLSVNVTDQVEKGNTRPVSSAAVYAAIDPAVDAALEEAIESGVFDGAPGKTAYQYAQDGGFTGTEEEFAEKIAKEHPKKISELENDSKFITASGAPVQSVNGKTGAVTLNADDVCARADDWMPTAAEVGARAENWMPTAAEVGALPNTYTPPNQTAEQVGADPSGTAAGKVAAHNTNTGAHSDIRLLISTLATRLDALANSDDTTLDQMAEVVAYIKDNRDLIEQVTTGKVSVTDIINNLSTNVANMPLSAAQGVAIKALIDGLSAGKLDASKLTEAINTALAQAKASGEFNGAKGDPGTSITVTSVTESAESGGSNVVKFSNGKTLTVKNGKDGNPGYTPQKGVDYGTPADQEAIVQEVITALGTPVFGRVDADNNIILTGELADGTYIIKYEDGEGNVTEVGAVEVGSNAPAYTNQIPLSLASNSLDSGRFSETGFVTGTRIGSGTEKTDIASVNLTGYIPFNIGDKLYISADMAFMDSPTGYEAISLYSTTGYLTQYYATSTVDYTLNDDGTVAFDPSSHSTAQKVAFVRVQGAITGNTIITVNEPIE